MLPLCSLPCEDTIRRLLLLFSLSVVSHSLWSHGLQHARLPCPSLSPRVGSNPCLLIQWCYLTISSSVVPFPSCLQSFPASGSFSLGQFFTSGGQSIGASISVLLMNIQGWFTLGLTHLMSLQSKGLSRVFFSTTIWKHQFFSIQPSLWPMSRCVLSHFSHAWLFATPWTITQQAPLSMGFSKQEYCSGLPFPSPNEKVAIHKLADSRSASILILDSQPPELWELNVFCLNHPVCVHWFYQPRLRQGGRWWSSNTASSYSCGQEGRMGRKLDFGFNYMLWHPPSADCGQATIWSLRFCTCTLSTRGTASFSHENGIGHGCQALSPEPAAQQRPTDSC